MMFAGGCGSGTLFTVGGGSVRMIATLSAFAAGSLAATLHVPWWRTLPSAPRFGLIEQLGPLGALVVLFALLAAIWFYSTRRERRLHSDLERAGHGTSVVRGPWPLMAGAYANAAISLASLLLLGRPWGITSAFTLWGAKIAVAAGVDVASWPYWQNRRGWLSRSVLEDATSVMNFGIMARALLATDLAGRFNPKLRHSLGDISTALLCGLCMGYGAHIAHGCNIGAYLGGYDIRQPPRLCVDGRGDDRQCAGAEDQDRA